MSSFRGHPVLPVPCLFSLPYVAALVTLPQVGGPLPLQGAVAGQAPGPRGGPRHVAGQVRTDRAFLKIHPLKTRR